MRSAETVLGIIRIAADTGEPGAPKGARPVRGGADGKVLTEQLASRLLYLVIGCRVVTAQNAQGRRLLRDMRPDLVRRGEVTVIEAET